MKKENLEGVYTINGINQDEERSNYSGILQLKIDENNRITAEWLINNTQTQQGKGFYHKNTVVINFNYETEENGIYKGVVVYKWENNILDGFWSEKHGNQEYLGFETGFKL